MHSLLNNRRIAAWLLGIGFMTAIPANAGVLPERVEAAARERIAAGSNQTLVFGVVDGDKSEVVVLRNVIRVADVRIEVGHEPRHHRRPVRPALRHVRAAAGPQRHAALRPAGSARPLELRRADPAPRGPSSPRDLACLRVRCA